MKVIKEIAASAYSGQFEKQTTAKLKVAGTFSTNNEKVLMQLSATVLDSDDRHLCNVTAYRPGGSNSMRYNIHDVDCGEMATVASAIEEIVAAIESELKE